MKATKVIFIFLAGAFICLSVNAISPEVNMHEASLSADEVTGMQQAREFGMANVTLDTEYETISIGTGPVIRTVSPSWIYNFQVNGYRITITFDRNQMLRTARSDGTLIDGYVTFNAYDTSGNLGYIKLMFNSSKAQRIINELGL